VEDWLNELEERMKRSPEAAIYSTLVRILKDDMLVADPQKRNKIENIRRSLESMTGLVASTQNRKDVALEALGSRRLNARPVRNK
jgi:hypothetical protein